MAWVQNHKKIKTNLDEMEGRDSPLCMVSLGLGCHIVQSHQSMVQP